MSTESYICLVICLASFSTSVAVIIHTCKYGNTSKVGDAMFLPLLNSTVFFIFGCFTHWNMACIFTFYVMAALSILCLIHELKYIHYKQGRLTDFQKKKKKDKENLGRILYNNNYEQYI